MLHEYFNIFVTASLYCCLRATHMSYAIVTKDTRRQSSVAVLVFKLCAYKLEIRSNIFRRKISGLVM